MNPPPPPPPPHGENPKTTSSGLPPGKYDIFIIPPHSSGSGFLYLPSLKPNVNSFAAGFASALILVLVGTALAPAVKAWWDSVKGAGGAGMLMLVMAVGVGAWALGRIQVDGPGPGGGTGPGPNPGAGPYSNAHAGPPPQSNGYAGPPPQSGPMPGAAPPPNPGAGAGARSSWQRPAGATNANGPTPEPNTGSAGAARSAWEKAREETKKKQEEAKAREAERKRKEELEKRLKEAREKEARERAAREQKRKDDEAREAKRKEDEAQERRRKEQEELDKKRKAEEEALEKRRKDVEAAEKRLKELREKEAREAREREIREKRKKDDELRDKMRKETEAREAKRLEEESKPRGSTYAFSAVGEKTNPWPKGRPKTPPPRTTPPSPIKKPPPTHATPDSPTKKPPPPTAKTYKGTEDDSYSYRPYDRPKNPMPRKKSYGSLYSESSYAASQSTSRTTPPPSHRGPYSTKDPDKIVIKAVYAFNNAFLRTPTSQLVSGVGSVTDGLILRITTEGLFIDDDVRHVPQREWDVKAWTMKLVEVWCPSFRQAPAGTASARVPSTTKNPVRRLWGLDKDKPATAEETDALVVNMLSLCKNNCRLRASSSASSYSASDADSAYGSTTGSTNGVNAQTGELKTAGLHVLRASIRDQEGKKYVFVIQEDEAWKVSVGLQRLRKGTQVRALGVSGMSAGDARSTLENLGWG